MNSAQPYVGITGVTTTKEVEDAIKEYAIAGYTMTSKHIPMLGYLMSQKTINELPNDNRRVIDYFRRKELFAAAGGNALTMIHYFTKEKETLADQIEIAFDSLYPDLCRAVQLNVNLPLIDQVKQIKHKFPHMQIVFQANRYIIEEKEPKDVAKIIQDYAPFIDYVLIDPSGGTGKDFDLKVCANLYRLIKETSPNLTLGFAGGLSGENVYDRAKDLITVVKANDFCIDAEGKLRTKFSRKKDDDFLSMEKVRKYLIESAKVLY